MGTSYNKIHNLRHFIVKGLTILLVFAMSACSIPQQHREVCKIRAYIHSDINSFINQRFGEKAPVRVGIFPFSVPANFSRSTAETLGLDTELAAKLQQNLLAMNAMPIIEVVDRTSWPRKNEEFFKGNFNALKQAREALYDIAIVGYMEPIQSLNSLAIYVKTIEVDSGTTLWYAKVQTESFVNTLLPQTDFNLFNNLVRYRIRPDLFYFKERVNKAIECLTNAMLKGQQQN